MLWIVIELVIRVLVFGLVFGFASYRSRSVTIKPRYALPLVALVFALLNVSLYWLLKPVLNLATLGIAWIFMPFLINGAFLLVTGKVLRRLRIEMTLDGLMTIVWMAALLTAAHGALYLAFNVIA